MCVEGVKFEAVKLFSEVLVVTLVIINLVFFGSCAVW